MNQNFCFGFTSPDDRLPIGKSGYPPILKHPPPRHQPPASNVTPTSHQPPAETTISLVNLKSKLPPKFQKYASFGIFPKLLLAPVAFLLLLGFSLARPFVRIRLYRMMDTRIGHLAANTEIVRLSNLEYNQTAKKKKLSSTAQKIGIVPIILCANFFFASLFAYVDHLPGLPFTYPEKSEYLTPMAQ